MTWRTNATIDPHEPIMCEIAAVWELNERINAIWQKANELAQEIWELVDPRAHEVESEMEILRDDYGWRIGNLLAPDTTEGKLMLASNVASTRQMKLDNPEDWADEDELEVEQ